MRKDFFLFFLLGVPFGLYMAFYALMAPILLLMSIFFLILGIKMIFMVQGSLSAQAGVIRKVTFHLLFPSFFKKRTMSTMSTMSANQ